MTYAEYLKDPRWQKRRLEIFSRDEWACRRCGSKDKPLNIHHSCYLPKKKPWEYDDAFLFTLCDDCHEKADEQPFLLLTALLIEKGSLEEQMGDCFDPALSSRIDCIISLLDNLKTICG